MRKGTEFLIPGPDTVPGIVILDIMYQQYITIMINSCNEEKIRPFLSLQPSVQYLLSPVQDLWRDMPAKFRLLLLF